MAIYDGNISAIINKRVKDAFVYRVPLKIDFEIYFLFNFFFNFDSIPPPTIFPAIAAKGWYKRQNETKLIYCF